MAVLFADIIGLWNEKEEGKAEFEVRRIGVKKLEGTRVLAASEQDAKNVYLKQHIDMIDESVKNF
jgi:hypothetical protein